MNTSAGLKYISFSLNCSRGLQIFCVLYKNPLVHFAIIFHRHESCLIQSVSQWIHPMICVYKETWLRLMMSGFSAGTALWNNKEYSLRLNRSWKFITQQLCTKLNLIYSTRITVQGEPVPVFKWRQCQMNAQTWWNHLLVKHFQGVMRKRLRVYSMCVLYSDISLNQL